MGSEINELITLLRSVDSEAIGDTINLDGMRDLVISMKRKQILNKHPYQITQSDTDKRWRTYIMVDGFLVSIILSFQRSLYIDHQFTL